MARWALVLVSLVVAVAYGGPQPANNLLVEYMPSPVRGLDSAKPRFGWQVSHTDRGQTQTAYQILVSSKQGGNGDVWNSGVVKSSQSSQVEYAGAALVSDKSYYWTVTWWDGSSVAGPVSVAAQFDTGILNPQWSATWIGGANQLRKEFNIPAGQFSRARLYICGLGYYVVSINGQVVGDKVLGPFTQFEHTVLYDTHDVTDYLVSGPNAIAVSLGRGFYAHGSVNAGPVSLIAMLSVQTADGQTSWPVATDTTWSAINGPFVADDVYIGVTYDARLITHGWDKPNFNSSGWKQASTVTVKGTLKSNIAHPQKIKATYVPSSVTEVQPGTYVVDFGQNIAGYARISAVGPAGTAITFRHGEMLGQDGTVQNLYSNAPMIDTFILAGTGNVERFAPTFAYHGFQYIQVTGYPGTPAEEDFEAYFIHSDLPVIGGFSSSSPVLNYIEHMTRFSSLANLQSIPTDCPTREKRGWMGDAQVSAETVMSYWDMGAFYTKFMNDIRDSQVSINKGGTVGDTAPFYSWGSNVADPAWGAAYTLLWFWNYQYYSDTRMLSTYYDGVKEYVENLISTSDPSSGILVWSRYGDWCAVADGPYDCAYPGPVVSAFYFYEQLRVMVKVSTLLNIPADTQRYSKILDNVAANWNKKLYNPSNHTYNNGYQTYQVLPLWLGLVPQSDYQAVVNYLLNDVVNVHKNHLTVGIVGAKYLLPMLSKLGRTDLALAVATSSDYPSWGNFASQGATTLWENWEDTRFQSFGSRNHIMFGGQGAWYYQYLAGIQITPNTTGYQDITIAPQVSSAGLLSFASGSIATQRGIVANAWQYSTNLCATAPEHANATLECQTGVITNITFASFGTPLGTCGSYSLSSCNAQTTRSIVEKLCLGKSKCSVLADDGIFGDPCPNVLKSLAIQYAGCGGSYLTMQTQVPVNSVGTVVFPPLPLSNLSIFEASSPIWMNGAYVPGTKGISGAVSTSAGIEVRVGSGSYSFAVNGLKTPLECATAPAGDTLVATCPPGHVISEIAYAHFGTKIGVSEACDDAPMTMEGSCSIGSAKHNVERACLGRNSCIVAADPVLFGDDNLKYCPSYDLMHVKYSCNM